MNAIAKLLPVVTLGGVGAFNADALKSNIDVIGKVQVAATGGIEMQGIAKAVAMEFIEDGDLPLEDFGAFLKANMMENSGKETRDKTKDPWGTAYRIELLTPRNGFEIQSAGPDKTWSNPDDLRSFYSLTGIGGPNAISHKLAARGQALAARGGASASGGTAKTPPPPAATGRAPKAPPTKESIAATTSRIVENQIKRAEGGSAQAQFDLANRYIAGDGVIKDYREAHRLLEQAVKGSDSAALTEQARIQLENLERTLAK